MLWLALHFPRLSLDVFPQRSADGPCAVASGVRRPEVVTADHRALSLGVVPGMRVAAAIALAPGLRVVPRSLQREAEALKGIATWAVQFTPDLSLAPPASLLLEVGGCLRLFGGLRSLSQRLADGLAGLGFEVVPATAPTPAGALTLARAGVQAEATDMAALEGQLRILPIGALDYPQAVLADLAAMGVRTLGDCLRLPRDGLGRRFGQGLPETLDRLLGRLPDPRPPFTPAESFVSELPLAATVRDVEALLFGLRRQLAELSGWLAARHAGVRRLTLSLLHATPRPPSRVGLTLAVPGRDPAHLLALFRERLERLQLSAGVDGLALAVDELAPLIPGNLALFGDAGVRREDDLRDRLKLVERLRARLGQAAVGSLATHPEHRPELAWREAEVGVETATDGFPTRPVWLLPQPRPLARRGRAPWLDGPLVLQAGPERIESGWWDGDDVRRDYYLAQAADGARLWIYREHGVDGGWFLHGLFG